MAKLYGKINGAWSAYDAVAVYRKENGEWKARDWSVFEADKKYLGRSSLGVSGRVGYVSLGDSIAAGHRINEEWWTDYGLGSQYGKNGNTETALVPGCYTDIIGKELLSVYGDHAFVKSFAQSGDAVADLMEKLTHETVRSAIKKAKLVTICIGANDVLVPAVNDLTEYIETGSLAHAESVIEANLVRLASDTEDNSYRALFDRLSSINPDAKYVFTTVYNPYKYLYLDEGHSGFFGPLLATIPQMNIDVDKIIEDTFLGGTDLSYFDLSKFKWVSIELELDLDGIIKDGLLATPVIQQLFDRVNNLSAWAEKYVEGTSSFDGLNRVLRRKIAEYQAVNPNFSVVDTKVAFDIFPDRTDGTGDVDYSDLVNVEFTRTFDTMKMDWGRMWEGSNAATFWGDLAWKHLDFTNALPSTNVWDYVSFDLNGFADELVNGYIIPRVIEPDVDPHPEHRGHEVMKRVFTNALGLVAYEANGGSHAPGELVYANQKPECEAPMNAFYSFSGWHTDAGLTTPLVLENTTFTDTLDSFTLADLVTGNTVLEKPMQATRLYAKWLTNVARSAT